MTNPQSQLDGLHHKFGGRFQKKLKGKKAKKKNIYIYTTVFNVHSINFRIYDCVLNRVARRSSTTFADIFHGKCMKQNRKNRFPTNNYHVCT